MRLHLMSELNPPEACPFHRTFFEQEFPEFADDAHFWTASGTAIEFGDGFNDAQIVMAEDDGQLVRGEALSVST